MQFTITVISCQYLFSSYTKSGRSWGLGRLPAGIEPFGRTPFGLDALQSAWFQRKTDGMDQFAVILEQYQPPPAEKMAVLFQAVVGLPKLDAMTKAARATGIVVESVDAEVARKLQLALGNQQCPARIVPQAMVPANVKGRRVQWVFANAEQFSVRWTLTGPIEFYPWSDVLVISAGVVFHSSKEQVIKTVQQYDVLGHLSSTSRGHISTTTEISHKDTSRDMAMATITLGRAPQQLQTLRLRAPELEYTTMLGSNMQPSPLQSFCLVLARIGTYATSAQITDETIELISAANATPRLPKSPRFKSEDEFDHYQRWLVTKALTA
jgi:hypothetical protein